MKKIYLILVMGIFLLGIASAGFCCEKTTGDNPAWCQNVNTEDQCDSTYSKMSASCDATSYCKKGTCINGQEGTCMSVTKAVCENSNGFWSEQTESELDQCKLGCCLIGDQATLATQISCNRMSALYGLEINWLSTINGELECLAMANPRAKGACVYTKNYVKTCELKTRKECKDMAINSVYSDFTFHENYLCSAQELGTECASSCVRNALGQIECQTQCDENGDVRFIDTCGELANIYDSSKASEQSYWTTIQNPSCGSEGSKNSESCGDCDYLSGSMCKKKTAGDSVTYGNYICKDLDCKGYSGQGFDGTNTYPRHGETWCATDTTTTDNNIPGSTYFRLACYDGEVTREECESTRQKICAEAIIDDTTQFKEANCKANLWQSCTGQNNSADCTDINVRDCNWIEANGSHFSENGIKVGGSGSPAGMCVPKYQPGFERDVNNQVIGGDVCGMASAVCYVKMQKRIGGSWYCDTNDPYSNCSCALNANNVYDGGASWAANLNNICVQLGDCGIKTNYLGVFGKTQPNLLQILNVSQNATG